MGFLDRFRRKKKDSVLPSEVDSYYKSELRSRRSTSILFAIFALIVTLAIAAALFFGGRAIYRTISKNDNKTSVDSNIDNSNKQDTSNSSSSTSTENQPTNNGSNSEGFGATTPQSQTPSAAPQTAPATGDNIPATGDSPELPHTGD